MKKQKFHTIVRNAVILALVFVLASQPVLVAAAPQPVDLRSQAVDLAIQGGDRYLESASRATVESAELLGYLNVIQNAPIDLISEGYIEEGIARALRVAEQSSIALGAVDDVADGIEQLGGTFPAAMNVAAEAGIPEEMRGDLIALGIPAGDVDLISAGASGLYTARQAGISAEVQASLLAFGFTQQQIDEIAAAVAQRGLVDPSLDTRLSQFRATQDELADTRSGMLILAVQLLGYQIAIRQANGIAPREVTEAELQELAEDEMRLLVHAAHLNTLWGGNPDNAIGEGDWWFIEHYAGRAAERLQTLIVETQNRGLVAELFIIHQMKMLAVSARTGDADYAKAELDALAGLLAHRLNSVSYYEQRLTAGLVERVWSRVTTSEALRGRVEWAVPQSVAKTAALVSLEHIDAMGVENLAQTLGQFNESNEENNTNGILIVAGLSVWTQLGASVTEVLQLLSSATPQEYMQWISAILTGDTDNPALLAANVILSLIPVLGVIPDLATLAVDPSIFVKALSILGIIGSIGDILALIPGLQGVGGASFVGDAVATVVKTLFKQSDTIFKAVLNGLKLTEAFDVVKQLTMTVVRIVGNSLGDGLNAVINTITNIFTGSRSLWGDFVAFVRRAGADLLLKLGFDEGSALVGLILRKGVTLSDEAIIVTKKIADDLISAGVSLSDEAVEGLGHATKIMNGDDLTQFTNRLINTCVANVSSAKSAIPVQACNPDLLENVLTSIRRLDSDGLIAQVARVKNNLGIDNFGSVMAKYGATPSTYADAKKIFGVLGDPAVGKDVISTAFKAGSDLGNKGPEALRALSGWDDEFSGILKNNDALAKELAQRAGKDAVALAAVDEMVESGVLDPNLVTKIAENSVNTGGNNFYVLGKWTNGLEGGYAKVARDLKATYFYPHPYIYNKLAGMPNQQAAWWAIDSTAIQKGANNRSIFKYTLRDAPDDKDLRALEELFKKGKPTPTEAKSILETIYGADNIPDRMKELQILIENFYEVSKDSSGLYIFKP